LGIEIEILGMSIPKLKCCVCWTIVELTPLDQRN